jgi:hypothetical protein
MKKWQSKLSLKTLFPHSLDSAALTPLQKGGGYGNALAPQLARPELQPSGSFT